jgi:cell division protein FtsZ
VNEDHLQRVRVRIAGVGDAGGKVIRRLSEDSITRFDLIAVNTASAPLEQSPAKTRLLLGEVALNGNGTGGNPALGRKAAEACRDQIDALFAGARVAYLVAGLGGGTGSGALPVIARAAREQRARTVVIVSLPFRFEGAQRQEAADTSLRYLADSVDELIRIRLDDLLQIVGNNPSLQAMYSLADTALAWEVIHKLLPNIRA